MQTNLEILRSPKKWDIEASQIIQYTKVVLKETRNREKIIFLNTLHAIRTADISRVTLFFYFN